MKRFVLFVLCGCALIACAKKSEVEDLQKQINELKSVQIASINTQVAGITQSIGNLQSVDAELRGYIQTLQQQKATLEQADKDLDQAIKDLKTELSGDITAAEANALAQLEAYKSTVAGQIAGINQAITSLQNKDTDLQSQITALRNYIDNDIKTYIDNGDQSVKNWVSATFATLDQFNATSEIIAGIQGQIASIQQGITQLASSKIGQEELDQAINALDTSLQQKIRQSVIDCNGAIATARQEITDAYTTAIQNAITASEGSMRIWVNNQLTGYYTIAQTDAKIASLQSSIEGQLSAQKTYLEGLITSLETSLTQKINTNSGLIEGLQTQINGLSGTLSELSATVATNARHISENADAIAANARNISTNAADIDACEMLIAENKRLIDENTTAINENSRTLISILGRVTTNEQNIADNVANIAGNAEDIAHNASLISANATAISNNAQAISDNAAEIARLRTDLGTARTEITEAYQSAISAAITTLDGKLSDRIASEVETLNDRIDQEVADVTATLQALSGRVEACETEIALIKETLASLRGDITTINGNISTINQQIAHILESISDLNAMDTTLNGYIETLRGQVNQLNGEYADLSTQIEDIKGQLTEQSAATAAVLAQLEAYKTTANAQIQALQQAIANLEAADTEIRGEISTLRSYVDTEIGNAKDWASATFSTLEQFNGLSDLVAGIKSDVDALQSGLAQTNQTLTSTKEELVAMITGLDQTMQQRIQQLTTSFNQALQDSYDTITEEYGVAIASAIESLESSMKAWVNEQLAGYYTIAETDAKLSALRTALEGQLNGQKTYLEGLIQALETLVSTQNDLTAQELAAIRQLITTNQGLIADNAEAIANNAADIAALQTSLAQTKQEITAAYQQAIATAIETLHGQLDTEITNAINTAISSLESSVDTKISALTSRVTALEDQVAAISQTLQGIQSDLDTLFSMIRSITYIPRYSDGSAVVIFEYYEGAVASAEVSLDFEIHPNAAAASLAEQYASYLTVKAVPTITKSAPVFIPCPITQASATEGILSLTMDVSQLPAEFFEGSASASIYMKISDGTNDIASDFIPMFPSEVRNVVTTHDATDATDDGSITLNGGATRTDEPGLNPTAWFLYSDTAQTLAALKTDGTRVDAVSQGGVFSSTLSAVRSGTTYYYVACAEIHGKPYYGDVKTFKIYWTEMVDLGLSVYWASYNLGAGVPEGRGNYYAWGETETKTNYSWQTYKYCNKSETKLTKYCFQGQHGTIDNITELSTLDDPARVEYGNYWRIPTDDEWYELGTHSTMTWTTVGGRKGFLITSTVSGFTDKSIFLPADGYREGTTLKDSGTAGYYWSSTIWSDDRCAYIRKISNQTSNGVYYLGRTNLTRAYGGSVRPVRKK